MVNWRGKGWGIKGRYWCWNFLNSLTKVFQVCKLPSIAINSLFDDGPRVFNMTQIWAICRPYNHPLTFKFSILEPVRGVQRSIRRGNVMLTIFFCKDSGWSRHQGTSQLPKNSKETSDLSFTSWFTLYGPRMESPLSSAQNSMPPPTCWRRIRDFGGCPLNIQPDD